MELIKDENHEMVWKQEVCLQISCGKNMSVDMEEQFLNASISLVWLNTKFELILKFRIISLHVLLI